MSGHDHTFITWLLLSVVDSHCVVLWDFCFILYQYTTGEYLQVVIQQLISSPWKHSLLLISQTCFCPAINAFQVFVLDWTPAVEPKSQKKFHNLYKKHVSTWHAINFEMLELFVLHNPAQFYSYIYFKLAAYMYNSNFEIGKTFIIIVKQVLFISCDSVSIFILKFFVLVWDIWCYMQTLPVKVILTA